LNNFNGESEVFLGLGSNIGDRQKYLSLAIDHLKNSPSIEIIKKSSVFETEPLYNKDQNYFYNMAVEIRTSLKAEELLTLCKNIEQKMGRDQQFIRNGPRNIDIDIEFFNMKVIEKKNLTIPHSGLYERRFVLEPLLEISGDFKCPVTGKTIKQLLKECPDSGKVRRVEEKV